MLRVALGRDPEDGQHVSFINRRIEADPDFDKDPAGLLAMYAQVYWRFGKHSSVVEDPKNRWHTLLKLSGLVLPRSGMLDVRVGRAASGQITAMLFLGGSPWVVRILFALKGQP